MTTQLRVSTGESINEISIRRGATLGELRRAIWRSTGVPWAPRTVGRFQRLMLHGELLDEDENTTIESIGIADGDVIQLIEDRSKMRPGTTDLGLASAEGEAEILADLLERSENPNILGDGKMSPLQWAALRGHPRAIEYLVGVGANVDLPGTIGGNLTPLHTAIMGQNSDVMESMGMSGSNHRALTSKGYPSYVLAGSRGTPEMALMLAEQGAFVVRNTPSQYFQDDFPVDELLGLLAAE